jgi:outer membrane usher protein
MTLVLALAVLTRPAAAADQTLLLDVEVNGYSIGKIGEFTERDGTLLARPDELRSLGFKLPGTLATGDLIALAELPGVKWRLDRPAQKLYVTAGNSRLLPTLLRIGGTPSSSAAVESGTGATLNYDISGSSAGGLTSASGLFDLRLFSPWGIASTNMLASVNGGPGGLGTNSAIRLDSTYTFSDVEALRRYRLGDFITDGASWTRAVRLGGIQVSSDFSLRPDLVTFPLPSVSGAVAVPSTVDVLVNGNRLLSQRVGAGPFAIPQLPVVTGAGTISMSVTNALGRQVNVELPFYASSELLAPGLQTYSAQVGAVRRNWGLISADYGKIAGTASYRRGVSEMVTIETSAEGAAGVVMAGAGVAANLFNFAVVNAAAAGSSGAGQGGSQVSVGLQRAGTVFSFGASATFASRGFRDVAAMSGDQVPRKQINASAGLSLGRYGSVGVAYASIYRDAVPNPIRLILPPGSVLAQNEFALDGVTYLQPAQRAQVLTASYSVQLWNMSFYATAFRDLANRNSNGVLFGVTIPLGSRDSVSASAGSGSGGRYGQVQASRSAAAVGDWGYQAFANAGNSSHEFAQLQYKSPWGMLTAGADRFDRQTSARVEAAGAVSFVDGGLFPSNTIYDSFAVVDTNGLANVRVLSENRDAGRTNSSGRLLVPDLRAFEINRLAIEPDDVPLDTSIGVASREVRPQDRSGVVVKFAVKVSQGALLRLVDAAGAPVPLGSTATLRATGIVVPVGFDGEAYVEDLADRNELVVELPDGRRCGVSFEFRAVPGEIPAIGPLPCKEQRP